MKVINALTQLPASEKSVTLYQPSAPLTLSLRRISKLPVNTCSKNIPLSSSLIMAAIQDLKKQEQEQEMQKVKVINKEHVKPNKKIGKQAFQLTTFDLPYLAFYYNQKLLFYNGGDEFEVIVKELKDGLGLVLKEFYQLAGKLGKDEEGIFRVEYDDDMDGVEVAEAVAGELCLADLTAEEGTTKMKDLLPYNGILNVEGLHRPLLGVQLTKLKDGLAIGCAFNHAILDGTATWHFMSAWAETCRSAQAISAQPFLDRLRARSTRVKLDIPLPSNNGSAPPANGEANLDPSLREKVFKFSESAIDKIKSKVNNSECENGKQFSTFQSLSAHIWHHVTIARKLKPEEVTVYTVFADCRNRLNPPLPDTYFGNCIQAIFTGTAAGLLLANPPEFSAGMIQNAINGHDAAMIEARNAGWESEPKIFQYKDAGANCVAVGSSPRFKVYDVDFAFGRPESVRSGGNNRFDGMVYLYQGKSGGRSIDVEISLEEKAMEELEKDKAFVLED